MNNWVATLNAATMHRFSAKPQVVGATDTRAFDDYDNLNDEECSIYASPFERVVEISFVDSLVPKQCKCKCRFIDKCVCGNISLQFFCNRRFLWGLYVV